MPSIFKVTYPNGKMYIGSDMTDTIDYFGSPDSKLIAQDFSQEQKLEFSVKKEILFVHDIMTRDELEKLKNIFIHKYGTNQPSVGYNKKPKLAAI